MIRDTISSLRVTLADRAGSPFVSATLVALVFVNWKLTLLIFSNVPYQEKIKLISDIYSPIDEMLNGFLLFPVFFGIFWTFVWPVADYFISGYWFWIKSKISDVRLKAERKKSLSHEEASDIYMAIDRQESRYLDVIKVRENRIEELNQSVSQEYERVNELQKEILQRDAIVSDLRVELDRVADELSQAKNEFRKVQSEYGALKQGYDSVVAEANEFSVYLPGLKAITNAIDSANNYHANEQWLQSRFFKQEPNFNGEEFRLMLDFFVSIGLIKRLEDGYVTFGDRYRYVKNDVLGSYKNSPGIAKPD